MYNSTNVSIHLPTINAIPSGIECSKSISPPQTMISVVSTSACIVSSQLVVGGSNSSTYDHSLSFPQPFEQRLIGAYRFSVLNYQEKDFLNRRKTENLKPPLVCREKRKHRELLRDKEEAMPRKRILVILRDERRGENSEQ